MSKRKPIFTVELGDSLLKVFHDGTWEHENSPNADFSGTWFDKNGDLWFDDKIGGSGVIEIQEAYHAWKAK